jgi:hypothetical protein
MNTGFYQEVVESSAVAVVVVGADTVVRHQTEEAGRMMVGPNADLVGKLFPSLFTPDTQTQVDACIRKATGAHANVRTTVEATCALRKNDGKWSTQRTGLWWSRRHRAGTVWRRATETGRLLLASSGGQPTATRTARLRFGSARHTAHPWVKCAVKLATPRRAGRTVTASSINGLG